MFSRFLNTSLALLVFSIALLFLSLQASAQTQPTTGTVCEATRYGVFGYGGTGTEGLSEARAKACQAAYLVSGVTGDNIFGGQYAGGGRCNTYDLAVSLGNVACGTAAVCLTGDGYIAADEFGQCPSDEDDEDNDGNPCDAGEEGTDECSCSDGSPATPSDSCPENDRDGDGTPDSEDDDDGVCDNDNPTDGDCDGQCNAQDEPDSSDCGEGSCQIGEQAGYFHPFDTSVFPYSPPDSICANNQCEYEMGPCISQQGNENTLACLGTGTGESCTECTEPSCINQECPSGQSVSSTTGQCEDIPNFCELDEDNDGTPDHQDSFACADPDENPCTDNPDDPSCVTPDPTIVYACQEQEPVCPQDASAIECASFIQDYKLRCSAEIFQDPECIEPFQCNLADPSLCAIAHTNYLQYCSLKPEEQDLADIESILNPSDPFQQSIDSGAQYWGGEGSEIDFGEIDIQSTGQFDSALTGIVDRTESLSFATVADVNADMSSIFDILFNVLGALVILSASIYATRAIIRAHSA